MAMISPQVMKLMIKYVEVYAFGGESYSWKGYLYGALLLITTCVQSVILSQYFERMFIVGMNLVRFQCAHVKEGTQVILFTF